MNVYVFADEAGNFDFSSHRSASKYFTIASITLADCSVGDALLELRRDLAWRGEHLTKEFHATDDPQAVRDEVFAVIAAADFRIDATLLEKSKTYDYCGPICACTRPLGICTSNTSHRRSLASRTDCC